MTSAILSVIPILLAAGQPDAAYQDCCYSQVYPWLYDTKAECRAAELAIKDNKCDPCCEEIDKASYPDDYAACITDCRRSKRQGFDLCREYFGTAGEYTDCEGPQVYAWNYASLALCLLFIAPARTACEECCEPEDWDCYDACECDQIQNEGECLYHPWLWP